MNLRDKYKELLSYAQAANIKDLAITEQNNVLYINGTATSSVKDKLWNMYNKIDPDMRAGDLVMNIEVEAGGEEMYEVKPGDNLSKIASKYPNMTWQKILEANKNEIKDANLIYPGQRIRIPL